jgi:indole-3-glycerol phosphate synthase
MNILEQIIADKQNEVERNKSLYPVALLEQSIYFGTPSVSIKEYLRRDDKIGIIAEIKRKSPSKGVINQHISVERTSIGYMQAGASALSVLTDQKYFGGKNEDLSIARKFNYCPILRKDFVIDEYQIIEAKSIGADVVLLIGSVLKPYRLRQLASFAKSIGLETLLEVHAVEELQKSINEYVDVVGVNNRDLRDFSVGIEASLALAEVIPSEFVKISESGISTPETLLQLKDAGYQGFLMGESFMRSSRPEKACENFVNDVLSLMNSAEKKQA